MATTSSARRWTKIIYWTPRVLSILFILFLALFSFDVFGERLGFWGTALAFLMHNIPVIVLTALLILSWKREIIGAIAFFAAGLVYIGFMLWNALTGTREWYLLSYSFIIAGPALLIGTLFLLQWKERIKRKEAVSRE